MGRPVTVRKSEASIPSSENLPNSQNIEDYIFEPRKSPGFTKNVDPSTTIEPLCSLSECIGSLLSDVFSNESSEENSSYLAPAKLDEYNSFLSKWRQTLPRELRWRKSEMQVHDYNPTVMNVRLYYYIVLICLNRPFIIAKSDDSGIASAVELCNTAISELSICLGKFNEAQFPSSILVVYSSILAISVLLSKLHSSTKETDIADDDLARLRSLMFIKNKVADMQNLALRQVFDSAEDASQDQLTDGEVEQLLEFGEDFPTGIQDNFFHGFFEFFNYEDGRPY
ncbi:putative activatory protein [Clavispora lusitaniae]|uniref:Activatory protein n=1 Tax=Clavispora lusitaniae TaxID=36911 RepID=A0AA91T3Y9_CLALS|nr:putative activatory protein [Clavispora lusitaniae]